MLPNMESIGPALRLQLVILLVIARRGAKYVVVVNK